MKTIISIIHFFKIALLGSILIFYNAQAQYQFEIIGKTHGFKDSTILYLCSSRKFIDSTFIISNSFYFHGSLSEPDAYLIQTKITDDPKSKSYKILWVDNTKIYFEGRAGDFENATLRGSESQQQFDEFFRNGNKKSHTEQQVIEQEFAKNHPHHFYSAILLSSCSMSYGKEKTKELYALLDTKLKKTVYGKKIQTYLKLNRKCEVGDKIAEIKLGDLKGASRSLLSLKGKYVLLEFWASWCVPYRSENLNLRKLYSRYKNKSFEIYSVTVDKDKKNWKNAVEADSINWITVSDLKGHDGEAVLTYGVNGIPANYLIDKNGIILAKDLRGDDLEKKMDAIFNTANK
jgi:peroxiredoxin